MENEEITVKDIESAISKQIYWKIPNNYFSIMEAITKGMSVSEINSRSSIANSFKDLAVKFSDDVAKLSVFKYRGDL
jgi:Flp pilus assembly CpaE family ATPase